MQENPYSSIINVIRRDTAAHSVAPWRLGRVTATSPLTVDVGGLALSGAELLVNPALLDHTRTVRLISLNGELAMEEGGGAVSGGSLTGTGNFGGVLAAGDQVVLLQSGDGQQYAVLCKVVSGA